MMNHSTTSLPDLRNWEQQMRQILQQQAGLPAFHSGASGTPQHRLWETLRQADLQPGLEKTV